MEISYESLKSNNGKLIRQHTIENKYPQDYKLLVEHSLKHSVSDLPFPQQIWIYVNNSEGIPKCKCCNNNVRFESFNYGYKKYCSVMCSSNDEDSKEGRKQTVLKKFGCEQVGSSKEVRAKSQKTLFERYGVTNPMEMEGSVAKIKKTTLERHGVENSMFLEKFTKQAVETNIRNHGIFTLANPTSRANRLEIFHRRFLETYSTLNFVTITGDTLELICPKCTQNYKIRRGNLRFRHMTNVECCTNCNPIGTQDSYAEKTLSDFVESLGFQIIKNDRNIINPKELDIIIPEKFLAIEFDGLHWHSDKYVEDDYHLNKTKDCNTNGYDLLHIYEDEWADKPEIVKSIIQNKLGLTINKIFARNCEIIQVKSKNAKAFLDENHIQGHVNSTYKYGLIYNHELVAIMTFGNLRKSLGNKISEGEFELLRYCSKLNSIVVGGASRLFKHFLRNIKPKRVITYANRRFFNGNMYKSLGMKSIGESKPNYNYYNGRDVVREQRFKYRKDVLILQGYNKNKSERQIMQERGYCRIYDCGTFKFEFTNNQTCKTTQSDYKP